MFVAPTRFAGGIPFKVHEAASYGLPVVASDLLCRQVGWTHGAEIIAGGTDDAHAFAEATLALYNSAETWNTVRRGALARLARENDRAQYVDSLRDILHDASVGVSGP